MEEDHYQTRGGIAVQRRIEQLPIAQAIEPVIDALDSHRGALLASSYEYPGRYTRWDMGFVDPPLVLTVRGLDFSIEALNERGMVLLPPILACLPFEGRFEGNSIVGRIVPSTTDFVEEERSRQPSAFTLLRALVELFGSDTDAHLGLYGAFGYDLAFQFEPVRRRLERPLAQRDLVLYLPDEIVTVDHRLTRAERRSYDFSVGGRSTAGLASRSTPSRPSPASAAAAYCSHLGGEYAAGVREARGAFKRGDLFEVVLSQTFAQPCRVAPSDLFRQLRERNPAPYGFLMNLGQDEYLVGASPEMYVRVDGDRVETCPISGTIARGADAIGDAAQILELLNSAKDQSELTMCTDVDRNDKSRVCRPGSVSVIGRRQIEMYSRVIHTVDHVEGRLRPEFDALDAFLAHTWAVTVTGAPKPRAMQFIEDHEKSPRAWYGGAVGLIGFNGNMNTGLTLRTIRIQSGLAEVRVGATLLYESDPDAEERETRVKASAFIDALHQSAPGRRVEPPRPPAVRRRILLVDHRDSFVHTLANYFRQAGAEVLTLRSGFAAQALDEIRPDLVVLSPGPGRPSDFDVGRTIAATLERGLPLFGVCLGLQAIVEYFGGRLEVLDEPVHGKASRIEVLGGRLFDGLPEAFEAGRYHSLYAAVVPSELTITATTSAGLVMAVEHQHLPIAAIQFHPESILTLAGDAGLRLTRNVVAQLVGTKERVLV